MKDFFRPVSRFRCIELSDIRPGMVKVSENRRKAHLRIKGLPVMELRLKSSFNRGGKPPCALTGENCGPTGLVLPKSLRLVQRPNGWYADLVYMVEKTPLPSSQEAVGIDLGVNNRLALSNGEMVNGRAVDRTRETALRQQVARAQKGSNRRRKAVAMLTRETRRNAVRNRNECHLITTDIVRRFGRIAAEKLRIPNMTRSAAGTVEEPGTNVAAKSGLNRSILEQSWGIVIEQLRYKAERAGREFVEVDPKYTSRVCSECGAQTPQSEYQTHACGVCGAVLDRDTNAAINVMKRGLRATGAGIPLRLHRR